MFVQMKNVFILIPQNRVIHPPPCNFQYNGVNFNNIIDSCYVYSGDIYNAFKLN